MKKRFSKATLTETLEQRIDSAKAQYEEVAGKPVDHQTGWAQVPKGNVHAAYQYGLMIGLEVALLEVIA